MVLKLRSMIYVMALVLFSFIGYKSYLYLFDRTAPQLVLHGIEADRWYAGDIACSIASTKGGEVSLWLDGQPLVQQFSVSQGGSGHEFTIPSRTIANGAHTLKAQMVDHTYFKNEATLTKSFYVDNVPLQAALLKSDDEHKVFQGRTLHVQFQVNKPIREAMITALSQQYPCFAESKNGSIYEAFIPIACEENPNEYLFSVDVVDNVGNKIKLDNKFQVVLFPFKKHTLQVSNEKMKEEEELGKNSVEFEEKFAELAENSPREKMWKGPFCTPVEVQRVSTEFGTVRTTQRKGRYAHKALDVLNLPKSVVWAPQDGVVVMKDRFVNSGNTVIIDHGLGVLTMLCHLDSFASIEVGQKIAKGNPVGTIGKTGYASGYHLHWEMRVGNVAIDPMQWTNVVF
jgi:murein DD-endopeptidase MepM/ murein hydrolase activator NlpD